MDILVIGAGVLGSLYAAWLHDAGHKVTILARGRRLEEIRQYGIILEDAQAGTQTFSDVPAIAELPPASHYDLAIVLVRKNQLASILPALHSNRHIPSILFMVNNAAGPKEMIEAVGDERVLLGFPGAGGERVGHVVRYSLARKSAQPTTLGELDGMVSVRLNHIVQAFQSAGFPVEICNNMEAWLKTHVALVSPVANALYLAGGDNYRLARTRDGLVLMARAVREGLQVLHALNIPITPAKYRLLEWIPEPILVAILQRGMATDRAELLLARHANHARDEMQQLASEFHILVQQSGIPTPAINHLYRYLDPTIPTLPEGNRSLALDWRSLLLLLGLLASSLTVLFMLSRGRSRKE